MPQPFADDAARDAFLAEPRLAILITHREGQPPMGVPVWFEWTGSQVRMFAARGSAKLRRIERDPQVSVLVTNRVGESEAWVAFDGELKVTEDNATDLVGRLGERYWDVSNPEVRKTLDAWVTAKDAFASLSLTPSRIRSGA
jgi:PPOX class probable F420-dependent enzyme